jgi:TRAP transporter TAXI family solute receptor
MNKIFKVFYLGCFLMLLVMLFSTFLTAEMSRPKKVMLRASGGPSGTAKDLTTRFACEAIRKENPDWVVDVINGPTVIAEVSMMGRGELDLARIEIGDILTARKGYYGPQKLSAPIEMAWLIPFTMMDFTLFTLEKVPFNSIPELKAKKYPLRVSMGRKGTGPYNMSVEVLDAYGITPADIERWGGKLQYQPSNQGGEMMVDGLIDAVILTGTLTPPGIVDIARNRKLKAIYVTEPVIQAKLLAQGFGLTQVPAGIFSFVREKTSTVGKPGALTTSRKMKDEVAYHLVRSIWERRESLYAVDPAFKIYLQPDVIKSWSAAFGDTLHPGAAKYWQEKGLLKQQRQ